FWNVREPRRMSGCVLLERVPGGGLDGPGDVSVGAPGWLAGVGRRGDTAARLRRMSGAEGSGGAAASAVAEPGRPRASRSGRASAASPPIAGRGGASPKVLPSGVKNTT